MRDFRSVLILKFYFGNSVTVPCHKNVIMPVCYVTNCNTRSDARTAGSAFFLFIYFYLFYFILFYLPANRKQFPMNNTKFKTHIKSSKHNKKAQNNKTRE